MSGFDSPRPPQFPTTKSKAQQHAALCVCGRAGGGQAAAGSSIGPSAAGGGALVADDRTKTVVRAQLGGGALAGFPFQQVADGEQGVLLTQVALQPPLVDFADFTHQLVHPNSRAPSPGSFLYQAPFKLDKAPAPSRFGLVQKPCRAILQCCGPIPAQRTQLFYLPLQRSVGAARIGVLTSSGFAPGLPRIP